MECCYSQAFEICNPPLTPMIPVGDTLICLNAENTLYSIYSVPYASTYNWTIFPDTAGIISGTDSIVTIDWNNTFLGSAKLIVQGQNG